ncbi:ribosome hibernation promotion factor [Nocardia vaccinii]|uniref:ribosome hibernation promotion factor n=1 Tax=Nocardia vaccinii TaxID=1822 RepID=UPI000A87635F|nr:sigma 54 modulation/S30EA ribosomal C-terminal domain-containing protein [Nocardia vaccinii]
MMRPRATSTDSLLQVSIGHHIPAGAADYAREKIGHALTFASEPVLSARVRMSRRGDPAAAKPMIAQANVNMNGRGIRVQVAADTAPEAIDLLEARLKERFERFVRHWEGIRGRVPELGSRQWRHDAPPRTPLSYFPRPRAEREVVRHKSYALIDETCEEAAFDMEMMDYDFYLFTESGSGVDSVLYRSDDGYRLAQVEPSPEAVVSGSVPITVSPAAAPVTTTDGAIERLELTGWPFVFFNDPDRHRGCVLYHRYDGHYGLLTPAE